MEPELAGLSPEEALLISDVLSRLAHGSSGGGPLTDNVVTHAASQAAAPEYDLQELDAAEQAIEKELRGLQAYGSSDAGASGGYPGLYKTASYGSVAHGAGGVPTPQGKMQDGSSQRVYPPEWLVPPSATSASTSAVARAAPPASVGSIQAPLPVFAAPTSISSSASGRNMSLLQEMREQLRQHQRAQAAAAADAVATSLSPSGQPDVLNQGRQQVNGAQGDSRANSLPEAPQGVMDSPRGLVRPPSEHPSYSGASPARANQDRPTGSVRGSMQASSARKSGPTSDAASPKAFAMLNARTNPERYGSESSSKPAGGPGSGQRSKGPVKLPEQERSARLQQLYERTSAWRKRCEERYRKERHEQELSKLEGCTFSPQVSVASELIMQGKPPAEVYMHLSKSSTPTKHQQQLAAGPHVPGASARGTSKPSSAAGSVPSSDTKGRTPQRPAAKATAAVARSNPASSGGASGSQTASVSPTPQKVVVNVAQVASRMYNRAFDYRARQEERVVRQMLEEEEQRRFVALVPDVAPRLYDPPEPAAATSRHLPSGLEECTFHPRTRYRVMSSRTFEEGDLSLGQRFDQNHDLSICSPGSSQRNSFGGFGRRPKSAPHQRTGTSRSSAGGSRKDLATGPGSTHGGGMGPGSVGSHALSRAATQTTLGAHTTHSISHELDWEEFLARQERFLAEREQKLQILEQDQAPMPTISPGSKRLLREREVRQQLTREAAASEGGSEKPAAPSSGQPPGTSPGRLDRRIRTIMEMYKECTFQPQITCKAAQLPRRSVEDLVDGGRLRHEEWAEQQRVMQELREAEDTTFRPQYPAKGAYSHVRPRISLRNPDLYLSQVAYKRQQREALRAELESEREALELQHCTFKPQTTPLPAYLIRRFQEQQQMLAWEEQQADAEAAAAAAAQDALQRKSHGSRAPLRAQPQYEAPGQYSAGAGAHPTGGRQQQQPSVMTQQYPSARFGVPAKLANEFVGAVHGSGFDSQTDEDLGSYQDAYQRALQATMYGT